MQRDASDAWAEIDLPAILPSGRSSSPEYWPIAEFEKNQAELPISKWEPQNQQKPTTEHSPIIKRDRWQGCAARDPTAVWFAFEASGMSSM